MDSIKQAKLRLFLSDGVGSITYKRLMKQAGNQPSQALKIWKNTGKAICADGKLRENIKLLNKHNISFITIDDEHYPQKLGHLHDSPPILFYQGNIKLLEQNIVGIVGSRHPSANAMKYTQTLAKHLMSKGFYIVSGLARGIDTQAHKASLPATIAVMACGLDHIYPEENSALFHKIADEGLVISEYPPLTQPKAAYFPRRNRIVAALSSAVCVSEASKKSGSLITARIASELGRQVFAVPSFPFDRRSEGCNYLIQNGAYLLHNPEEVVETLANSFFPTTPEYQKYERPQLKLDLSDVKEATYYNNALNDEQVDDNIEQRILKSIQHTPTTIEFIMEQTKLSAQDVQYFISKLEISGYIQRHGNDAISLIL
jgi:DNA processing protein